MKTKPQRPFEYLGVYALPPSPVQQGVLVVMHLEITPQVRKKRMGHSIATAVMLFGKKDAINGRAGLPDLLCAGGLKQTSVTD